MGAVYLMTQLPQLLNARIPSPDEVRGARMIARDEHYLDLESEDSRVEWVRGFANGWSDEVVFAQLTWDGWQPARRWVDVAEARRVPSI